MVDIVLKILLLLSPIAYGVGISLNKFDMIFFHVGSVVLFFASLFDTQKRKSDIVHVPIISLLGISLLSLFWHNFDSLNLMYFLTTALACLSLITIIRYCKSPTECIKFVIYAAIINIAVYLFQRIGFNPILDLSPQSELGGIFGNAPRLMTYLAVILPFIFRTNIFLFSFCLGLGIINKELGILAIGFILILTKAKRGEHAIALCLAALVGMILLRTQIMTALILRFKIIWSPALTLFFKRPLLGYGLGSCYGIIGDDIFNSYLQFIFNIGILGLVWIGYVLNRLKKFLDWDFFSNSMEAFALLAVLFISLIEYPFEIPRIWFTIVAIIGFFVIQNTKEEQNADDLDKVHR